MSTAGNPIPTIELISIEVQQPKKDKRGSCWERNVADEFPIESIMENNGETVVHVGKPHQGYTIITNLVNSKMNGTSRIYSEKKVLIARLQFMDGIANGHCTLYDEYGNLYYKGYFANGLLEGRGTRYDELGKFESEVFYKQGKQLNIIPMEKKKGYWKELDSEGNIISVCQKDEQGKNEGICYFYTSGHIQRISKWNHGEEREYLKVFNEKMTEYKSGRKVYQGGYIDSVELNYPRDGKGKEFNKDGTVKWQGSYKKGRRDLIEKIKEYECNIHCDWLTDYCTLDCWKSILTCCGLFNYIKEWCSIDCWKTVFTCCGLLDYIKEWCSIDCWKTIFTCCGLFDCLRENCTEDCWYNTCTCNGACDCLEPDSCGFRNRCEKAFCYCSLWFDIFAIVFIQLIIPAFS